MALSKDDVLNAIAEMSVMEVVELISDMEEKFGVSAAAAVAAAPVAGAGGGDAAAAEEKDEFDVVLSSAGDKKAKALVDEAPSPIKEGASKDEAEDFKKQLEEAGATVELK